MTSATIESTRPILNDSEPSWSKVPYQVQLGNTFSTMADAIRYSIETNNVGVPKGSMTNVATTQGLTEFVDVPNYIGNSYYKDTRVGYNDAINCLWQYNRDDDIMHPLTMSEPSPGGGFGEGRVYAKTTEATQSIAWFSFGVPRFTNLTKFILNAANQQLTELNNSGFSSEFSLGYLFTSAATLAFSLPIGLVTSFVNAISDISDFNVDRFYNFRPTMHLYYRYVDSILAEWLVDVGMYGNGQSQGKGQMDSAATDQAINAKGGESSANISNININYNSWTASTDSLPITLRKTGVSIFDILAKRALSLGVAKNNTANKFQDITSKLIKLKPDEYDTMEYGEWSGVGNLLADDIIARSALGATQFVGFRIEKNTDASESFSNSTGPSELGEKINSMAQSATARRYDFSGLTEGDGFINGAASAIGDFLKGASEYVGLDGIGSTIAGGAMLDIPEHYTGSDFNKSHSFNFQLRSPYGDVVSIYQSIIIPLAMLLAAALPHAAGPNAYSQPFLCRVYCKGLFSIPMGIIDSISIRRGSSEFGWNENNLPTCVDVSLSIKDLTSNMYMSIATDTLQNVLAANSSFSEYLLTLSGTGLFERISKGAQIRRKTQLMAHMIRNQITNVNYWCNKVADFKFVQAVGAIIPSNYQSHN